MKYYITKGNNFDGFICDNYRQIYVEHVVIDVEEEEDVVMETSHTVNPSISKGNKYRYGKKAKKFKEQEIMYLQDISEEYIEKFGLREMEYVGGDPGVTNPGTFANGTAIDAITMIYSQQERLHMKNTKKYARLREKLKYQQSIAAPINNNLILPTNNGNNIVPSSPTSSNNGNRNMASSSAAGSNLSSSSIRSSNGNIESSSAVPAHNGSVASPSIRKSNGNQIPLSSAVPAHNGSVASPSIRKSNRIASSSAVPAHNGSVASSSTSNTGNRIASAKASATAARSQNVTTRRYGNRNVSASATAAGNHGARRSSNVTPTAGGAGIQYVVRIRNCNRINRTANVAATYNNMTPTAGGTISRGLGRSSHVASTAVGTVGNRRSRRALKFNHAPTNIFEQSERMISRAAASNSNNTASLATTTNVAAVVRQTRKHNYRSARSNKKMKTKIKARKAAAAATNNNIAPRPTSNNNNNNNIAPRPSSNNNNIASRHRRKRKRSRISRKKKSQKSRKIKKSKKTKIRRETMRQNRQGNPAAQVNVPLSNNNNTPPPATTMSNQSPPVVGLVPGQIDIKQMETMLSTFNSKTVDYDKYKDYLNRKFEVCAKVEAFYSHYVFRKLRLQSYQNTRKAEASMINQFKAKFGGPEDVFIGIGDFEQRQHMKYKPPSLGKGLRRIFRKHGYMIFLVDEFRTSMMCCKCQTGENEKFMLHKNRKKKPKENEIELGYRKPYRQYVLNHGLIRCQNVACGTCWNRDINGAKNIYHLIECWKNGEERPQYLSRKRSDNNNNIFSRLTNGSSEMTEINGLASRAPRLTNTY
jgi:hypothetical protein